MKQKKNLLKQKKINTNHIYIFSTRNRNTLYEVWACFMSLPIFFSSSFHTISFHFFLPAQHCDTIMARLNINHRDRSRIIFYPLGFYAKQIVQSPFQTFKVLIFFALSFSLTAKFAAIYWQSWIERERVQQTVHDEIYTLCCLNDVFSF